MRQLICEIKITIDWEKAVEAGAMATKREAVEQMRELVDELSGIVTDQEKDWANIESSITEKP